MDLLKLVKAVRLNASVAHHISLGMNPFACVLEGMAAGLGNGWRLNCIPLNKRVVHGIALMESINR